MGVAVWDTRDEFQTPHPWNSAADGVLFLGPRLTSGRTGDEAR